MIEYKILLTEEERFNLVAEEYFEAVEYEDWEKVASLIKLNPDIMAEGLELVYRRLPDQYKYSIPTSCYTHNGDRMPIVRKYVRQARKYAPIEERIPAEMIGLPEIEIYRYTALGRNLWTKRHTESHGPPALMLRNGSMIEQ